MSFSKKVIVNKGAKRSAGLCVRSSSVPGGSNVLYMDGHVAFQRYEEKGDGPVNSLMAILVGLLTGL
ncbi:MAG: hypothetical protein BWY07_00856 [Candidatus Hydrogenedentes bacterium ADurb.Bin170]|nr:MAG: hypothetical protein BWY07_00856 [Candidatus Hydrogenedentes bacterium ADurb.Bin170]